MPRGKPDERVQLLFGPYQPPALKVGDRAFCLARDSNVVITSWTDAPISWPRCRALETRGGSGILVEDELARAIRNGSAVAIRYRCGATVTTIAWWRKSLGVGRTDSEGSRRLYRAASEAGAAKTRGQTLPPDQVERRRQRALALNLAQYIPKGYDGPWWTAEEIALLGTAPDEEVGGKVGRAASAVRAMRVRLGIPNSNDRRRKENRTRWLPESPRGGIGRCFAARIAADHSRDG